MMRFEEIVSLRNEDIPTVYRELTSSTLAAALKDAPAEVAQKFFGNMPPDMASMIKQVIGTLGKLSGAQVEAERRKVLELVKSLQAQHKIG